MSRGIKTLFVVGALGGFLVLINILSWPTLHRNAIETFLMIEMLAFILVGIGIIGLWRKSGNFVPLIAAVFLFLQAIVKDLLYYLWRIDPFVFPFGPISIVQTTVLALVVVVAWLLVGVSVWMERESFGPFALIAFVVFMIWVGFNAVFGLLIPIDFGDLPLDLDTWLTIINYAIAGIFFVDAARIEN